MSHQSVFSIAQGIVRKHGMRGLMQGLPITLARECLACPMYYGLYEICNRRLKVSDASGINVWATLIAGSFTGFVSFTLTHPIDVIKSNQQQTDADSLMTTVRRVCITPRWWCRGIVPVWMSIVPATAICFLGYETTLFLLRTE